MKTVTALQAKTRFGQIIEAAQREPVTVTRQGRASVVIMSADEFERRQKRAWRNLVATMDLAGERAAEKGLTEDELERLLSDDR